MGSVRVQNPCSRPVQGREVVDKNRHVFPQPLEPLVGHRDPLRLVQKGMHAVGGDQALRLGQQAGAVGGAGDVLDFVQRAYRVTLPEAARMLGAGDVPKLEGSSRWPIAEAAQGQDNSKAALAIWNRAQPAAQTHIE